MQEIIPVLCGLALGAGLGALLPGIRLPAGAVLSVAIGVLATDITGDSRAPGPTGSLISRSLPAPLSSDWRQRGVYGKSGSKITERKALGLVTNLKDGHRIREGRARRAGPVSWSEAPTPSSGSPGRRSARTSMSASAGFADFRPQGRRREARSPKRLNRRRTAGGQRRPRNLSDLALSRLPAPRRTRTPASLRSYGKRAERS
jgi:hypothetical protein